MNEFDDLFPGFTDEMLEAYMKWTVDRYLEQQRRLQMGIDWDSFSEDQEQPGDSDRCCCLFTKPASHPMARSDRAMTFWTYCKVCGGWIEEFKKFKEE